jgi:hypothetical protein
MLLLDDHGVSDSCDPVPKLVLAGRRLDGRRVLEKFLEYPQRTPGLYDLPPSASSRTLTRAEVVRTRAISSRISNSQADWFVARAAEADTPWPDDYADLRDADPAINDGLYVAASALYEHFWSARPLGVSHAKISKVLHLKRPSLYPILDSHVFRSYRQEAKGAASRYPAYGYRRMYWAAIRDDLLAATEADAFTSIRCHLRALKDPQYIALASLSDLRLLDIISW